MGAGGIPAPQAERVSRTVMFRYTNYILICVDERRISHGND